MPKAMVVKDQPLLTKSLPSVSVFFNETWALYKKVAVPFIFLSIIQLIISLLVFLGLALGGLLIGLALGLGGGLSNLQNLGQMSFEQMMPMIAGIAAGVGIFSLVIVIAIINLGSAFQASLILLTARYEGKIGVGKALTEGFKYVVPVLIVSLITLLLVLGGFFLFLIPGILMGILMSFAAFEVVLENRKPLAALKASISMVSQNFWSVVGRMVLIWLASVAVYIVLGIVESILSESVASLLGFIFNIALMPLGLVAMTILYRHTKAASAEKPVSMTWMWITALIGAIIGVSLITLVARSAGDLYKNARLSDSNEVQDWSEVSGKYLDSVNVNPELAATTFSAINDYRTANNLVPLIENTDLCSFSNWNTNDIEKIQSTGFHFNSEVNGSETAEMIVNEWVEAESSEISPASITNPDFTQGCVSSIADTLTFAAGQE